MQESANHQKPIQIIPIFSESLRLYKDNFILSIQIVLVGYAVGLFQHLLSVFKISLGWFGFIISLGGFLLTLWASVAIISAISKRYANQEINTKTAFVTTWNKIWRYFWVSTVGFLISIVGLLLLFIPGIYLGTIFMLAGIVLVLEDTAFFESFKRSKSLIQGHFWSVVLLNFFLFILGLLFLFVWKLDINVALKGFGVYLINLFYWPFSVAIVVNVYNRLKGVKEAVIPSEGETVKKGVGCLGCLTAVGLLIAMIILSSVWFKNIGTFIKSEKGGKVYEWVARQVSSKIDFQDGSVLERPKGYLVIGGQQEIAKYALYGFLNKKSFIVSVLSIPYDKLGITDTASINLYDEIWNKYFAYLKSETLYSEVKFKNMEKSSSQVFNVAGRPWGEYILKEKEYDKSRDIWVYNYTPSDNAVIFVSYGHEMGEDESELDDKIEEIKKILSDFRF